MKQILFALFGSLALAQFVLDKPLSCKDGSCQPETDECLIFANVQTSEMLGAMNPDTPPFSFDSQGKVVIQDQSKIINRNLKDGTETIVYKVKMPKIRMAFLDPQEFETVERTMVIKRDSSGRLTSVSKLNPYDFPKSPKLSNKNKSLGWPSPFEALNIKSMTGEFTYDGDKCSLNQSISVEKKDKSKEEKKVYYDKKLCDQIMPGLTAMGSEAVGKCADLIVGVEAAYDKRSGEIAKEGKSFKEISFYGKPKSGVATFNLVSTINMCLLSHNLLSYGTMGIGVGAGMYGTPVGGDGKNTTGGDH